MAVINAGTVFSKKKETTVPIVAVPKNVKEALCIDQVRADGIFKIEPGTGICLYDRCYVFEDVNYINKDEDQKMSTLLQLMNLFKSFSYQFKFTIANERVDMETFVSEIFQPIHGEEYPVISQGVRGWINQKIEEGSRDIRRIIYLTVTCRTKSFADAEAYFNAMDTTLQGIFTSLRSRLYRLNGEERLAILQKMLRVGESGIAPTKKHMEGDGWKNQIMPAYINSGEDCMKINNRYVSVLFAQDYDDSLNEEQVIRSLTDSLFPIYITLDMEPIEKKVVKDRLKASHVNNENAIVLELDQKANKKQFVNEPSYELRKKKKELEILMEQVDDNDEEGTFLGMLVVVQADDMEMLSDRVETLKNLGKTCGYTLEPYLHRQLKALNTALPIGGRQVNNMRSLLTSSAVAFQPFSAKDLSDVNGQILGLNDTTKHLLRGNRKKLKSPHAIVVGFTGSGKSLDIKLTEISQTLIGTDDDIIAIDPNNELEYYTKCFGGSYFDLTPHSQIRFNPFEVPRKIWEGDEIVKERFIAGQCDYAARLCAACMKNITVTQLHLNFVIKAVQEVYAAYFSQKNYKKQPTLIAIRDNLLKKMEGVTLEYESRMFLEITGSLEAYTEGVYDMFAHTSNADIRNRLCVFGLKNIPESARKPIMLTLMHCVDDKVEYNYDDLVATHLIVDETQLLCDDEFVSEELLHAIETFRKYGGIITLLFQNLTHAIEHPKLRDMFSNCPCKIFFDQGGVDAEKLAEIQELSEKEYLALCDPRPGHGILVWDKEVYLLDAQIDRENILFPYLDTDFHEKADKKVREEKKNDGSGLRDHILELLSMSPMDENTLEDMCFNEKPRNVRKTLKKLSGEGSITFEDGFYHLTGNE